MTAYFPFSQIILSTADRVYPVNADNAYFDEWSVTDDANVTPTASSDEEISELYY